jgi:hypothetical protein
MENNQLQDIKRGRFKQNNAATLRALNLMRTRYERLSDVKYALPDMAEQEYLDSINYLYEAGYLLIREVRTKAPANPADYEYGMLEGKLSHLGIKILAGDIIDNSIGVI